MTHKHPPGPPPILRKEILEPAFQKWVEPFRIVKGKDFLLKDFDPGDTCGLTLDKGDAAELLERTTTWLSEMQDMLYAQDRWSLLLVFQAMDAAGKDSTIKHVMSGVNPQGCQVFSFKLPSAEDLSHDFLWRYIKCLPERGRIGIFNRSHYEEVLVVRVHEELLKRQKLPSISKHIWDERLADIAYFEDYSPGRGRSFSSSFCTYQGRSRRNALSSVSISRTSAGNSPLPISASANSGTSTCRHSRRRCGPLPQNTRPGLWCRQTTNGSHASL